MGHDRQQRAPSRGRQRGRAGGGRPGALLAGGRTGRDGPRGAGEGPVRDRRVALRGVAAGQRRADQQGRPGVSVPAVVLNNGVEIPQLGLGVWRVPADETRQVVATALDAGYRHIDTARLYDNEEAVGAAVRESGLDRDQVFVTTKVWNSDQGYDATLRAFDASMGRLGFDVLDLYLIHWPRPGKDTAAETWRAMEKLYADGRVRAIGVSNFHPDHLRRLLDKSEVVPVVNQVELHPYLQQVQVRKANEELGVVTEAWSPLAKGGDLLRDPHDHRARRQARRHPRTGGAPLARAARHGGDPQVGHPRAHSRQPRRVRVRPRRAGPRLHRHPRPRGPHRPAPRPPDMSRERLIVDVLETAFADLMEADPHAFRVKFRKMAADPFAFYRGSACLFYADMAEVEDPWADDHTSRVWIHGDLHAENFGTYMNSDGRMVFDVNDFDEAYLGHFSWDLRRFVAS